MSDLKKAFAYLRISSTINLDGDGFPRQREAVDKHAAANGIEIVQYFEERAVSGTKELDDRPALQELLVALLSNGVRTVLIEKLDRLARDLMVQESIITDFKRKGLEIISVYEPDLCSDDPTRVLMRQIMGAFAEYERKIIVTKLAVARQRMKKSTGRCEGKKPYGTYEGEFDVINAMFKFYNEGVGYSTQNGVTRSLNEAGYRQRNGELWNANTVRRIMLRYPEHLDPSSIRWAKTFTKEDVEFMRKTISSKPTIEKK